MRPVAATCLIAVLLAVLLAGARSLADEPVRVLRKRSPAERSPDAVGSEFHLAEAVRHLKAAGYPQLAAEIVERMARQRAQSQALAAKVAQLKQLSEEIAALRKSIEHGTRAARTNAVAAPADTRRVFAPRAVAPLPAAEVVDHELPAAMPQVLVNIKMLEVSLEKLRSMGIEVDDHGLGGWLLGDDSPMEAGAAGAQFDVLNDEVLPRLLEGLRKSGAVKLLAEPTLVTVAGRKVSFHVGGEFPIHVKQKNGTETIEFQKYGTEVDLLPALLKNGKIRLNLRPRISEIDHVKRSKANGRDVPGLRVREIDTSADLKSGQTLIVGGLVQKQISAGKDGNDDSVKTTELIMLAQLKIVPTPTVRGGTSDGGRVGAKQRSGKPQ